jgi:hypothetical protein
VTYIGVRAAARILGVHENTVRNYMRRGWLTSQALPIGGHYTRFDDEEVRALAEAQAAWRKATRRVSVNPQDPDPAVVERAARALAAVHEPMETPLASAWMFYADDVRIVLAALEKPESMGS